MQANKKQKNYILSYYTERKTKKQKKQKKTICVDRIDELAGVVEGSEERCLGVAVVRVVRWYMFVSVCPQFRFSLARCLFLSKLC